MIIILNRTEDITNLIGTLQWSGDKSQMARKLTFDYVYAALNSGIRRVEVTVGMRIQLYTDSHVLLFDGIVTTEEYSEADIKKSITAADYAMYLKSDVFGHFTGTPATVARMVLQQFDIPTGDLADAAAEADLLVTGDKTIYQTIMAAYEAAGMDVYLHMDGLQVCIRVMGSTPVGPVSGDNCLLNAKYTGSIENMYNRVAVINKEAALQQVIDNPSDLQYGVFQKVYTLEDKKNPLEEAGKLFRSIENAGSVELKGDISFRTGNRITIIREQSKVEGSFDITSDTHTFSNGEHKASLTLDYKE